MWALAVSIGATEFAVRDRLCLDGINVFCPFIVEKVRVKVTTHPRVLYKAVTRQVALWPRYLFCRVPSSEVLSAIVADRDVSYLVKTGDGLPALLADEAMSGIMRGCDAEGKVTNRARFSGFSVGDLLHFVQGSNLAGHTARVLNTRVSGAVEVLVDNRVKAIVDPALLAA